MEKKLIIIGGGYAGNMLAQAMDNVADVTLVEPRDRWFHNVALMRALVQPALLEQILIPYDGLLKNGSVVRDRAESIEGNNVTLASGETLYGDAIVVATGSQYAAPFKMQSDDSADLLKTAKQVAAQIDKAAKITIVGAGAVGTELAGELAFARPDKNVTLVSAHESLFPEFAPKLGKHLLRQLQDLGVVVRTGERIQKLKRTDAPFVPVNGKIQLSDGFPVDSDLVIPVLGTRAQNTLLQSLPDVEFDDQGRAQTDGFMRPSRNADLFVVGDAGNAGDIMTIFGLTRQVPWLVKTLKAHLAGQDIGKRKAYKPWGKPHALIPLGPDKGASAMPGFVAGPFLTSAIKGKKLFIPRYHSEFDWTP